MSRKKPRALSPDEQALWARVAETAKPLASSPSPKKPKTLRSIGQQVEGLHRSQTDLKAFEIGQRSKTRIPSHDLSPTLSESVDAMPLRMDKKAYKNMSRGRLKPEGRIDLHGMTVDRAHSALTSFVLRSHAQGKRLVLVITGKGRVSDDSLPIPTRTGVLKHQLPHWLNQPPLSGIVLQIAQAHQRHGGAGAFYIYLRRS